MEVRSPDAGSADADRATPALADAGGPDPRIARLVADALGGARTVVNVGAASGTYASGSAEVTAVEPSRRPPQVRAAADLPRAVPSVADLQPFEDGAFDGAMTLFGVHQWAGIEAGLREMRRVARGPVVVLTSDPAAVRDFWLYEYAPEVLDTEARRHPSVGELAACLGGTADAGGSCRVRAVPIPWNCTGGFNEAYYGRPEMLLDPAARQACASWSFVDDGVRERFTTRLRDDLASGKWDARFGHLRRQAFYEGSLVILRATGQDNEEHHHGRT